MTARVIQIIPADGKAAQGVADRMFARALAAFLAERHPHHTAKLVGQDIARVTGETIHPETLRAWAAGKAWPANERHVSALFLTYGAALGLFVFGAHWRAAEARIEREQAEERARLDRAKAERRAFLGLA